MRVTCSVACAANRENGGMDNRYLIRGGCADVAYLSESYTSCRRAHAGNATVKLIDDWKRAHTYVSTQSMGLFLAAIWCFNALPHEMRDAFTTRELSIAGSVLLAIGLIGRYIDGTKKDGDIHHD